MGPVTTGARHLQEQFLTVQFFEILLRRKVNGSVRRLPLHDLPAALLKIGHYAGVVGHPVLAAGLQVSHPDPPLPGPPTQRQVILTVSGLATRALQSKYACSLVRAGAILTIISA